MKIMELIKRISGKAVAEPRRQENWNFPIKEYVQSHTVYTEEEETSNEIKVLYLLPMTAEGGAR